MRTDPYRAGQMHVQEYQERVCVCARACARVRARARARGKQRTGEKKQKRDPELT